MPLSYVYYVINVLLFQICKGNKKWIGQTLFQKVYKLNKLLLFLLQKKLKSGIVAERGGRQSLFFPSEHRVD